ncbi:hypothetical protein L0F63_006406, partial [Massospora cicadina]
DKLHCHSSMKWTRVAGGKLRADALVNFPINVTNRRRGFTHLKVQILPDGCIKRVRALGYFMSTEAPDSRPDSAPNVITSASEVAVLTAQEEPETRTA